MFLSKRFKILIVAFSVIVGFITCTKKWDEHNQVTDNALNNTLMQAISATPNLTKFADLLVKSGYDKIISSSKTYTVWAPTDQALQSLDPSIASDSVKLRQFVGNHIANQSYLTGAAGDQRIKMLNGKFIVTNSSKFDSANIITTNVYANNGIIHTIDKYIPRMDNIWEFVNSSTAASAAPAMRNFLLSLNHVVFDPTNAKQTGVNPNTGEPIYDTASGAVLRNSFLDTVMNVNDETNQYTLILLNDNAYSTEFNKLTPWFKASTTDSTNRFSGYWLVKDLAFKGVYSAAQLPDTIVSQYGVKVPINKSAITASYRTSNGIVHVMSQVNFTLANKFPPIYIQGENPTAFQADRSANTFYRVRYNPVTGQNFNDILMQNYNVASYWILYRLRNMPSMKYNAYWVAVNDVQTTPLWSQRLGIDSTNNTTLLPAVQVAYKNYNEVSLGTFTNPTFKNLNLYVIGPTSASSSGGSNSIVLDYIKLVPAF
jgi:uncharacterized surface protein with fasciclin (FAS1) repeats